MGGKKRGRREGITKGMEESEREEKIDIRGRGEKERRRTEG